MSATPFPLPPYGVMDEFLDRMREAELIPPEWKPQDRNRYLEWREIVEMRINEFIWPRHVAGSATWINNPHVDALNDADFKLLADLSGELHRSIQGRGPAITHEKMFLAEDDAEHFGANFRNYDPDLPTSILNGLPALTFQGYRQKTRFLTFQLKHVFQRPRPYQVAFLRGIQGFKHLHAGFADTPSLISGHAIQGAIGVCHAFNEHRAALTPALTRAFRQLAVDIGDRRVFAGVHYPSDNLSSWLTAFMLLPRVFSAGDALVIRDFLWDAISKQSDVFEAMQDHAPGTSPYTRALDLVMKLGTGQII